MTLTSMGRNIFSTALTLRRIAHEYKREALEYRREGNERLFQQCKAESDRYWQNAKDWLDMARWHYV